MMNIVLVALLWHGPMIPIVFRVPKAREEETWDVHEHILVTIFACLDDSDTDIWIFRKPRSDNQSSSTYIIS